MKSWLVGTEMTAIRTLQDIESELDLITKRRRHLEDQRLKLDQEISDLTVRMSSLEMQRGRLAQIKVGE